MKFKNEVIIMENYGTGACIAENNGDMTINVITGTPQADQMSISINGMGISDYVREQIAKGKEAERRAKQQVKQALREALKRLEDE